MRVRLNGGEQVVPLMPVARDVFQVAQMTFRFLWDDAGRIVGIDYSNPVFRNVEFVRVGA